MFVYLVDAYAYVKPGPSGGNNINEVFYCNELWQDVFYQEVAETDRSIENSFKQ